MKKILRRVLFQISKKLGKHLVWLFPVKEVENGREKEIFQEVWHRVWVEEGYALPNEPIVQKYAKYDNSATDLLCRFLGIWPVGTMRLIWEGPPGLPALNDFEVQGCWDSQVVEVTLLTLKREWRGLGLVPSLALMREGYRRAKKAGAEGIVMITEKSLFYLLTRWLGLPFQSIGATKLYEGGLCFPAYMSIKKAETTLPKTHPNFYTFFTS